MLTFFRPILARLLAAAIAGFCGWLVVRFGINVDADTQQQLAEALVGIVLPIVLGLYAVAHKWLNKRINPGDTASSHLAEKSQAEAARLKAIDSSVGRTG